MNESEQSAPRPRRRAGILGASVIMLTVLIIGPSATIVVSLPLVDVNTTVGVDAHPLSTGSVERRLATEPATGRIKAAPARGTVRFGFETATGFEVFDVF